MERPVGYCRLFLFALPTMLSNLFMGVYGVVDGVFASNFIGTDALSCVNICMPIVMITLLIGIMLGTGGNALIAKKLGEGKEQEAREDFSLLTLTGVCISILLCVLLFFFRHAVLRLLGADDTLMEGCLQYTVPLLFLIPFNIPGVIFETAIITAGRPRLGLAASVIGGVTNIFLDWLFIAKLQMGLTGASLATCIGYCVPAWIGVLYFIRNRDGSLYLVKPKFRFYTIWKSCTNGSSEMVGTLSISVVTILLNNILMGIAGSDGVAAVSVVLYAQGVFSSLSRGYATGISPIVSYQFGRRDTRELRRCFRVGLVTSLVLSAVTVLVCFWGAAPLVRIFASADTAPSVYEMATAGFRLFAFSLLFGGANILISALFTALNDGVTSAVLSFLRTFLWIVLPLVVLSKLFGMQGVWLSFPVSELLAFLTCCVFLVKLGNEKWLYRNA